MLASNITLDAVATEPVRHWQIRHILTFLKQRCQVWSDCCLLAMYQTNLVSVKKTSDLTVDEPCVHSKGINTT